MTNLCCLYKKPLKQQQQLQYLSISVFIKSKSKQQMKPITQSVDHGGFGNLVSPSADRQVDVVQSVSYLGNAVENSVINKSSQFQQYTPNTKQSTLAEAINEQHSSFQMPQILDMKKTQQTRQRHAVLKHTIQSTIQQLLHVYKNRNSSSLSLQQQLNLKNQIFQRFAYIYTQMNEVKGDIQNAINFLNQGVNITSFKEKQYTPNKSISLPHSKITEKSQSFQDSSEMKQEEDERKNQEESHQDYGQASLEERCQNGKHNHQLYDNSMDPEV